MKSSTPGTDSAILSASKCLRGLITAAPGKVLMAGDFSSIEARVLSWLAGDEEALQVFRDGRDPYKVAAAKIYGCAYEEVTKEQRQIGKITELACGYQGAWGAFASMAKVYGVEVPKPEALKIIRAWRKGRPKVVRYWAALERAAAHTILTDEPTEVGVARFTLEDNFLKCMLPAGRQLHYYDPSVVQEADQYGGVRHMLWFKGVDALTKKWTDIQTYGGKLAENLTQAVSRDLLCNAIDNVESAGIPVVMHVHDEVVAEVEEPDLDTFLKLIIKLPDWAAGLPMAADGWVGRRYRK